LVEPQQGLVRAEQGRDVSTQVGWRTVGYARVVIFDDAHKFNPQSANSMLKVLEEPPKDTYFVLISNSMENVLPTLRWRSQVFRFSALSEKHLHNLAPEEPTWLVRSSLGQVDNLRT